MIRRQGIIIPLVVVALVVFGIFALMLIRSSQGEYRLTKKSINQERARMVGEAGLAHAAALIFQNPFEDRWYKQNQGPYGYFGTLEGEVGEGVYKGQYKVVGEDVANQLSADQQGDSAEAKAGRIEGLKYNRVDLFAEGVYGDSRVLVYQAVILYPEQAVFAFDKADIGGVIQYSNVRIR